MLEPDSAHNNAFDAASSRFFYHRCQELAAPLAPFPDPPGPFPDPSLQELGVPLLVLSRFAAYGCQVPRPSSQRARHKLAASRLTPPHFAAPLAAPLR